MPAYLESTNNDNDRRYARLGFEPFGVIELPNGHRITTMWRHPQTRRLQARTGRQPDG
jgi:hypothetical protein